MEYSVIFFSKERKLEILIAVKKRFELKLNTFGLCYEIFHHALNKEETDNLYMLSLWYDLPTSEIIINSIKELSNLKPKEALNTEYWFPLTEKGNSDRIQVLSLAIEKLKQP